VDRGRLVEAAADDPLVDLISPIRPVATKSIGTAVFLPTITCEWSAFLSPVSNIQMVLKPLLDIAEKSSDPIVDLAV
jgi:hypothetical protein